MSITLMYSVCKMCQNFMFTSNCLCLYSFHPVEPLIIEHMINMDITSKTRMKLSVKFKLLSIQEKYAINVLDAT
jgi:hypothetical protein